MANAKLEDASQQPQPPLASNPFRGATVSSGGSHGQATMVLSATSPAAIAQHLLTLHPLPNPKDSQATTKHNASSSAVSVVTTTALDFDQHKAYLTSCIEHHIRDEMGTMTNVGGEPKICWPSVSAVLFLQPTLAAFASDGQPIFIKTNQDAFYFFCSPSLLEKTF